MKRTTTLEDFRVETFDLSEEQHNMAVEMVKNDEDWYGNYSLEDVDGEIADVWIADAHSEGNTEYAEFLRGALAKHADLYTLVDTLGEFKQEIGELAVFY